MEVSGQLEAADAYSRGKCPQYPLVGEWVGPIGSVQRHKQGGLHQFWNKLRTDPDIRQVISADLGHKMAT
jgi:hypothetical protein